MITTESKSTAQHVIRLNVDETIKAVFESDYVTLVEFVNNALGTQYKINKRLKVEFLKTEFIDAKTYDKVIADLVFKINGDVYHIEFQTLPDNTMLIRIFEYGFKITLENLKSKADKLDIVWPAPLVIFIEKSDSIPDFYEGSFRLQNSDKAPYQFKIPTIKVWEYSLSELVERKYFFLIPFSLISLRGKVKKGKMSIDEFVAVVQEAKVALDGLQQMQALKDEVYSTLLYTLGHISDHFNEKYFNDSKFEKEINIMLGKGEGLLWDAERRGEEKGKVETIEKISEFIRQGFTFEEATEKLLQEG